VKKKRVSSAAASGKKVSGTHRGSRDIAESKHAEAALRESEDRYRDLVENSRDLMCTHDLEGNLLSVNEASVRLTGYSREALLKMNLADLLAPEVRNRLDEHLKTIRATGRAKGLMKIRTASGETRYWDYNNTLRTEDVSVPVVRGTAQDVTEARRASKKLYESEERHRLMFQNSSLPMWMYDVRTLRFLAVNPAATLHYGYSEAEFLGMTIKELRPAEDLPVLEDALRLLEPGKTSHGEWRHRKKNGEIRAVEVSSDSILLGGREARLVVVNDITDRKHAEQARDHALALLRATLESTADGIMVVGLDRRIESFNRTFAEMWRIPAEVLATGDSKEALRFVQDKLKVPEQFLERVAYMYDHPLEETFDTLEFRDGRVFERFSLPMIVDGRPQGRVLSYRNVTERQKVERALRESEEQLRRNEQRMRVALSTIDVAVFNQNLDLVYEWMFRPQLGFAPEQVVGKTDAQLLPPEAARQATEIKRRALETGSTARGEVRVALGERTLHYDIVVEPLQDADGRNVGITGASLDITERKRSEQMLRESEENYRRVVETLQEGIWVIDKDANTTYVNPHMAAMLEYQVGEMLGRHLFSFTDERGVEISRRNLERRRSGIRERHEFEMLAKSGRRVLTEMETAPIVDESGSYAGAISAVVDVTDRRRAEMELGRQRAALTDAHRLLQTIIDTTPARIFWKDRNSRYLGCNPAYARDAGEARPEDLVGKDDSQFSPWKEQADLYRAEDRRLIESGIPMLSYENRILIAEGRSIWARGSKVPLRDERGEIIGVLGTYEDISENKSAEETIRAEKEISEAILDSLPGMFFLFDQAGRFLRWNRVLETVTEYSATEIAGMNPLDFFRGEDLPLIEKSIRSVFETGSVEVEAVLTSKSGKGIPHYFAATRISWMGVPCCVGTGIDLSARKSLEAALQQAQKIEAVGQLAGGVAHDFNNLLGVILGYGELALSEVEPGDPVARHVTEMLKAAKRGAALTHQLQAFGRKQILQPKLLNLNLLVFEEGKMLSRVLGEDVVLVDRLAPELGTIRADPNQIDQILLNLAVNARDAMPGGGTLTLETANVEFGETRAAAHSSVAPGRYVRLAVADTGVGMNEETQRRIFEPFFTTKPIGQGTGMGLATVYGIVKQSEGYISVDSEPGRGTTFEIYFPRLDAIAEAPTPAAPFDFILGGTETILLVEDNLALREVTRQRLEESGYTVLQAENGEAALTLAAEHGGAIDLLLTDVVMPKLGGVELARRLASLRSGFRLLYMSGFTGDKLLEHGVVEEGGALLTKPFTHDQLTKAVRQALDRPGFGRTES
jgi:PAS domain S-box-containing protein